MHWLHHAPALFVAFAVTMSAHRRAKSGDQRGGSAVDRTCSFRSALVRWPWATGCRYGRCLLTI